MTLKKPVESLTLEDFREFPIWRFTNRDESKLGETVVEPVESIPVRDLTGCLVGAQLSLNNGMKVWGILSNLFLNNAERTKHLKSLSIFHNDRKFHLAHYLEFDYEKRGPSKLAEFLGLSLSDVFPISYDISKVAVGNVAVLKSSYPSEPEKRLSEDEIIRLALG